MSKKIREQSGNTGTGPLDAAEPADLPPVMEKPRERPIAEFDAAWASALKLEEEHQALADGAKAKRLDAEDEIARKMIAVMSKGGERAMPDGKNYAPRAYTVKSVDGTEVRRFRLQPVITRKPVLLP